MQAPRRHPETPAERAARIGREADTIAKAHADIESGLGIEDDALEAWFDQLDQDDTPPPPAADSLAVHR